MENKLNEDNEFEKNMENTKDESVEFLKNIGLSEVSNKTFIHEEELTRFLNGDFRNINKTKAMGFIQILQREYRLDLTNLKNRYLSYLEEHHSSYEEPKESIMMEEVRSEQRTKSFFTLLFLLLAIGSIAYFIKKYDLLKFDTTNIIETVQIPKVEQVKQVSSDTDKVSSKNVININDILDKKVKEEEKTISEKEDNKQENIENTSVADSSNVDNTNQQEELDLSQLNSDLAKNDENEELNESIATSDETDETNNTQVVQNELYIIPSSKVWIGTIDLDTFKKSDFLAKKDSRVDIDTSTNKLIMIGHKFIKIYFNGELVNFKRRGPIRFKYIDGQLEEINRREFNKLAKGKHW